MLSLDKRGLKEMRRKAQIVFQNPYSSLDPRKTVLQIVGEPLVLHKVAQGRRAGRAGEGSDEHGRVGGQAYEPLPARL